MQHCSLQHWTLLLSQVTSTTGCCFCFGSIRSFFLDLFHWSPVSYWALTNLGISSLSVLSFCLFILFMGFSRQEYWSGLPFPSPVDHILSDSPPWPDHLGWPYTPWLNFTELDKSVVRVISSLFFLLNVCWTHIYYYRSLIELIMSLILLYYINVFFPQMYVLGDIWHLSTLSSSVEQVRI